MSQPQEQKAREGVCHRSRACCLGAARLCPAASLGSAIRPARSIPQSRAKLPSALPQRTSHVQPRRCACPCRPGSTATGQGRATHCPGLELGSEGTQKHPSAWFLPLLFIPGESRRLWKCCLNLAVNRAEGLAVSASFTCSSQVRHHCQCCSCFSLEMLALSTEQSAREELDVTRTIQSSKFMRSWAICVAFP